MATFVISLPSFYVLNSLLGLRRDFAWAVRSLIAAQAGLAIVLASLAPLTLAWYASSAVYQQALLFNGAMFAVASFAAQRLVRGYYRPLIAADRRHALAAVVLARRVHRRGDSNGVAAAAVHRLAGTPGAILAR